MFRRTRWPLTFVLLVGLYACAGVALVTHHEAPVWSQATHSLTFPDGMCSGTAVGAHTLLTAAHCLTKPLSAVDGKPVKVQWIAQDDADHALIGVDRTFARHAAVGSNPVQGDEVVIVGNPGDLVSMLRRGYVAGASLYHGKPVTLYDMRTFFGDSGAGIFGTDGQLIGVQSMINSLNQGPVELTFAVSFPLAFTAEQWGMVR